MILPKNIAEPVIALKDQFFDLKGLSAYSALAVPTLRDYIKAGGLPCFKIKGKLLVRRSEFDDWMNHFRVNRKKEIDTVVDAAVESLRRH